MKFKNPLLTLLILTIFVGCQQSPITNEGLGSENLATEESITSENTQEFLFTEDDLINAPVLLATETQTATIEVANTISDGQLIMFNEEEAIEASNLSPQLTTTNFDGLLCNIAEDLDGTFKYGIYRHFLSNAGVETKGLFGVQDVGRRIQSVDCKRNGTRAVFSMQHPGGSDHEIFVVDEFGAPYAFTDDAYEQIDVTMSADGSVVAWNVTVNGKGLIVLRKWTTPTTFLETVISGPIGYYEPSLSNNGEWLVFVDNQSYETNIYRHRLADGVTTNTTTGTVIANADIVKTNPYRLTLRHPSISDSGHSVGWMEVSNLGYSNNPDSFKVKNLRTGDITTFVSNDPNLRHAQIASLNSAVYSTNSEVSSELSVTKVVNFYDGLTKDIITTTGPNWESYYGDNWVVFPPAAAPTSPNDLSNASGLVIDQTTGAPITGARVILRNIGSTTGPQITEVPSDSDGKYQFTDVAPGHYTVEVFASGYTIAFTNIVIQSGLANDNQNITLTSLATITGVVTDAITGLGVPNASISISGESYSYGVTDSNGNYSFTELVPGTYFIETYVDGYVDSFIGSVSHQVVIEPGIYNYSYDFSIQPLVTLSGVVLDEVTGAGVPNVYLDISSAFGYYYNSTTTDSAGNYSLTGLGPDTYTITAYDSTYYNILGSFEVIIPEGITTYTQNLNIPSLVNLSGVVVQELTGVANANLNIFASDGRYYSNSTITDSAGNYSFNGLRSGSYTIYVYDSTYSNLGSFEVVIPEGVNTHTQNLVIPATVTLSGVLTDSVTGAGVPNAYLELTGGLNFNPATTDSVGNYSFTGLHPGSYYIYVYDSSYNILQFFEIVIPEGVATYTQDLSLLITTISGTVTDKVTGALVPNATIGVYSSPGIGGGQYIGSATADSIGNYNFIGLLPGTYRIYVDASGYANSYLDDISLPFDIAIESGIINYVFNFQIQPCGGSRPCF